MRKIAAIIIALLICVSSVAFAKGFDEKKLTADSITYAEAMAEGDFAKVSAAFSKQLKKKLNMISLTQSYNKISDGMGEFVEIAGTTYKTSEKYTTVQVIMHYKNNGIKLTLTYNDANEIDGLFMAYSPLPYTLADNDKFKEKAIKLGDPEIDGILCLPKGEVSEVAILVQGSGQTDMNETVGGGANTPFKDIAHGLAEKGIATIRYNKRFYQYPETAKADMTVKEEVLDDVALAIAFAKDNKHAKFSAITIIGHSLGGMLAPKIAQDNPDVARIISLAGSPRNLADIALDQATDAINASSIPDSSKKLNISYAQSEVNKVKKLESAKDGETILGFTTHYWLALNKIDTPAIVKELKIPMLFLQGTADFQVKVETDYKEWQKILAEKSNATFKTYDKLNHMFMTTKGKTDATEYNEKSAVDKNVIDDIAAWIKGEM